MFTRIGIGHLIVDDGKNCMSIGLDDRHLNVNQVRHWSLEC